MPNVNSALSERQKQVDLVFTAELQFRLASAVRLATSLETQPLDLPVEWTHAKQSVKYEEVALRHDQADFAACFLHRSATYLMAVAIKDAIRAVEPDPKNSTDSAVRAAYQISRLVRNAFAHGPFSPKWSIDPDCQGLVFAIPDVIRLDTTGIDGKEFDWHHYGGPLALFRLCQFVRFEILKADQTPRTSVPVPNKILRQQGNLILQKLDKVPKGAEKLVLPRHLDGGVDLESGHVLQPWGEADAIAERPVPGPRPNREGDCPTHSQMSLY